MTSTPGDGMIGMMNYRLGRAVYKQLADTIRDQICSGQLPAGAALPSYAKLATQYGVSIDIVTDAMTLLRSEGLLDVVRGQTARVRPARPIEMIAAPPQALVSTRMPTPAERELLSIGEGVPILVVRCSTIETIYAGDRSQVVLERGRVE